MTPVFSHGILYKKPLFWGQEVENMKNLSRRAVLKLSGAALLAAGLTGTLTAYRDGTMTLLLDEETEMNVERSETAFIRLYNDFSGGDSK